MSIESTAPRREPMDLTARIIVAALIAACVAFWGVAAYMGWTLFQ